MACTVNKVSTSFTTEDDGCILTVNGQLLDYKVGHELEFYNQNHPPVPPTVWIVVECYPDRVYTYDSPQLIREYVLEKALVIPTKD